MRFHTVNNNYGLKFQFPAGSRLKDRLNRAFNSFHLGFWNLCVDAASNVLNIYVNWAELPSLSWNQLKVYAFQPRLRIVRQMEFVRKVVKISPFWLGPAYQKSLCWRIFEGSSDELNCTSVQLDGWMEAKGVNFLTGENGRWLTTGSILFHAVTNRVCLQHCKPLFSVIVANY